MQKQRARQAAEQAAAAALQAEEERKQKEEEEERRRAEELALSNGEVTMKYTMYTEVFQLKDGATAVAG